MSEPQPTQTTPASEWRRAAATGELYRLPGSGNVARLVRPSLVALAGTANGVPNKLSTEVQRLLAGQAPARNDAERWASYQRNAQAYIQVAALCMKEPRLEIDGTPGENAIGPSDLADLDYLWIYHTFVEGAAVDAAPFRVGLGPTADRRDGAALWEPAERTPGGD